MSLQTLLVVTTMRLIRVGEQVINHFRQNKPFEGWHNKHRRVDALYVPGGEQRWIGLQRVNQAGSLSNSNLLASNISVMYIVLPLMWSDDLVWRLRDCLRPSSFPGHLFSQALVSRLLDTTEVPNLLLTICQLTAKNIREKYVLIKMQRLQVI